MAVAFAGNAVESVIRIKATFVIQTVTFCNLISFASPLYNCKSASSIFLLSLEGGALLANLRGFVEIVV